MANQIDATIAKKLDITVKQNQTFNAVLTFIDADNTPIDLSGAIVKLSVRQDALCGCEFGCAGDSPFEAVYKQDFEGSISGADNNIVTFDDIIKLSPGTYKYDMLIVFPDESKKYFLTGNWRVKRSYTNITT